MDYMDYMDLDKKKFCKTILIQHFIRKLINNSRGSKYYLFSSITTYKLFITKQEISTSILYI